MIQNVLKNRQKTTTATTHENSATVWQNSIFNSSSNLDKLYTQNCFVYCLLSGTPAQMSSRNSLRKQIKHHPTIKFTAEISCTDAPPQTVRHHNIQGPKILQGVSSRYEDTLQTNGDIAIQVLYIVSPTGSEERLCKWRSPKTAQKKLFNENI